MDSFLEESMEKWVVTAKRADFYAIAERFHIDPVTARVIRNRDIVGDDAIAEYLYGDLSSLRDPLELKDMDLARDILLRKIREGKKIRIIGDYDIDGVMSSYILKTGIARLGGRADIRIPNRMSDGYGINERLIREAYEDETDTILTCDNGISADQPLRYAKSLGMTAVVTDHHEVTVIPEADAVVDPKRPDDQSVNKNLCGGAVAWKLIRAMGGDPDSSLLQFAAFATVGDVMDLTGENRIIVKEGIRQLRETDNPGLRALAQVTGTDLGRLGAWQIGFILGPCLNASGRLDTAMRAEMLLESPDIKSAMPIAEELKSLNESRKSMTESGVAEAEAVIESSGLADDRVLVVYLPDVHESIAGIIAGRLRESRNRPAIVLTRGESAVKGSGRSVPGYSMFEELVRAEDLLIRYGGHPMAAGLSLKEEQIGALRERLNGNCVLTEEDMIPRVRIDVPMPVSYVTEKLIRELSLLEPFGRGNDSPLFGDPDVICRNPRLIGSAKNVLKMQVRHADSPVFLDAIAFRNAEELYERAVSSPRMKIAYEPQINEYMGTRSIQIVISHFQ